MTDSPMMITPTDWRLPETPGANGGSRRKTKDRAAKRRVFDDEGHAQFVTFSCYRRRKLLDHDRAKRIVIGLLAQELKRNRGLCAGFVIMPDHVHAIVWFPEPQRLSLFMKQWKQRSSYALKQFLQAGNYGQIIDLREAIWQARYYAFNVFTQKKLLEKLKYMHDNPVRAGLCSSSPEWQYSSARFYELGKSVGIPVGLP